MDWDSYFGPPAGDVSRQRAGVDWGSYFAGPQKEDDWREREARENLAAIQRSQPAPPTKIRGSVLPLERDLTTGKLSPAVPDVLYDPYTFPGDVMAGRADPNDPARGLGLAGLAVGARLGARAPSMRPEVPAPKITKEVPSTSAIKDMATQLYKEADDAGVQVTPSAFNRLAYGMRHFAKEKKLASDMHPSAWKTAERLYADRADPKKPPRTYSLQDIDQHRRRAGIAAKGYDPKLADDRRLAAMISDRIDDWWSTLRPQDIASGDLTKAQTAIKGARPLWARMRKAEMLDDIQERALNKVGANYTSAGLQTALRQEFKSIANNKGKMAKFSKEEQAVIRRIVRGASLENALRYLGKFAPSSPMSLILGGGTGYAVGGPIGSAALMGAGTIARDVSARMGQKKVDQLNALVRRGYGDDAEF